MSRGEGLLQDREDGAGGAGQGLGGGAGLVQVREVERSGDVAAAVGGDGEQRGGDRPGALVGDGQHLEVALGHLVVQHRGDQDVPRAAGADHLDGGQHVLEGPRGRPGEEVELEVVGRDDVGGRHDGVAQELRDARLHEHPAADVAHHRVAAVEGVGVELLDPRDRVEDDATDGRVALVARQHGVRGAEGPAVVDARDHLGHVGRVEQGAAPRPVPGVVGEVDRQHRPHLVTEPLQREDGRGVADVAVGHRGLDRQDAHGLMVSPGRTPRGGGGGWSERRVRTGRGVREID